MGATVRQAHILFRDPAPDTISGREEPDWTADALCAQITMEDAVWFPEKGGSTREAKRICARCEVRPQCLLDALERGDRHGVRGGLSERERRRISNTWTAGDPVPEINLKRGHHVAGPCPHCGKLTGSIAAHIVQVHPEARGAA